MYDIPYFKAPDNKDVIAFMQQHPFIMLCGADEEGKPVATHIPVLIEEREGKLFLIAHVMRKQDHTKAFETNPNVLAIFHGPHTYVSASWYENQQVASTWNYQAVHARGVLKFLDDKALHDLLAKLTSHFENNSDSPSLVHKMNESYVHNLMKAIVAFEIEVIAIQHTFKLSQNHSRQNYENIITQLSTKDDDAKAIAHVMNDLQNTIHPA